MSRLKIEDTSFSWTSIDVVIRTSVLSSSIINKSEDKNLDVKQAIKDKQSQRRRPDTVFTTL